MADLTLLLNELWAAQQASLTPLGGLEDLMRMGLAQTTQDAIQPQIAALSRRAQLLTTAAASLAALVEDGYPELAQLEIPADALADLKKQDEGVDAALLQFKAKGADTPPAEGAPAPEGGV